MTRISEILGPDYDSPATLPESLAFYQKPRTVTKALRHAESTGDAATVELLNWELGILTISLAPSTDASPFQGRPYEAYAQAYHLTDSTTAYARERVTETQDLILKIHHLTFILLRSEPRGRAWIELQQELLATYRTYIDNSLSAYRKHIDDSLKSQDKAPKRAAIGGYIDLALRGAAPLIARPGIIKKEAQAEWAQWLISLAEQSLTFPEDAEKSPYRHRWVADYLEHLAGLPLATTPQDARTRATALLGDATTFYESDPLADTGSYKVAEVECKLRKHWGEPGDKAHEDKIRRMVNATLRRAEFLRKQENWLVSAHFIRDARKLVEQGRRFFTQEDITRLQLAEQAAINIGTTSGELTPYSFSIEVPAELMDYTRETPEQTINALFEQAINEIPNRQKIEEQARETSAETPLFAMLSRKILAPGKVAGESDSPEGNLDLDIESRAMTQALLFGTAVANTAIHAAQAIGLTEAHLVAPLSPLALDDETMLLLRHGCERLIAQDFISASHILVLRIEDVLRQHLRNLGVDTTEFKPNIGDGTSRTDDATLGQLMRRALPDGRTIKEYIGNDLWMHIDSLLNSQTGLNLRNEFAHGLARPQHCTANITGITLALLYQLANAVSIAPKATSNQP
ncbi:DUF4209 domain-containing protein [Myxococcus xanthus]|uniref:DUF4209 domain-containing protein n=1 Tax=Myxococcus xanthus TaxID=34 RepID=A0A7Y4IID4_MYXXA|nr:DUF4209 domain-containing protein [Myxococcus xanthus]